MISGAIFDVDGTLLDSMPMWEHAGERYLSGLGIKAEDNLEEILFTLTMSEGAAYIKSKYLPNLSEEEILKGINNTISDFYKYEVQTKPGVRELLNELHNRKIPMTIATSTDRVHIEAALNRLGLIDYFVKINTSTEIGVGKEKPDIFIDCAKAMNSDISNTYVFEDAYHAAKTARCAGFIVIGILDDSSKAHHEELIKYSNLCFKDFPEYSEIVN